VDGGCEGSEMSSHSAKTLRYCEIERVHIEPVAFNRRDMRGNELL